MPEAERNALPRATNDTWRTWLMTGARRTPIDRRRMRGAHKGLKKMLIEGMGNGEERPHAWKDFSGAMIRHAVDDALRSLPSEDKQVVTLAYFGGLSNREIALEVGLTEATVQRRLRRALATISEHIQHGRALGRRAMYAVTIWLSGRWLSDSAHHFAQAAAVIGTTAIVAVQPIAPSGATNLPGSPVRPHEHSSAAAARVPSSGAARAQAPAPASTTLSQIQAPPVRPPSLEQPIHLQPVVPPIIQVKLTPG
ncbi:MAG: sigma-70 family RNA polymerase sigma factor [Chloroflexi bacterium]|nr:MAG: sigma-70 family RNA polymerase sigma factor [Chloroflexota bacterium]